MVSEVVDKEEWDLNRFLAEFISRNSDGRSGAINIFVGIVKEGGSEGRVANLYLEAYKDVATEELQKISNEVRDKYGLNEVEIKHAIGMFEVGEPIVYVAIAAPSRRNMYDAMREAIEGYKSRPPIFKKEIYVNGSSKWV